MIKPRSQPTTRSKWFLPLFSLGLGIVVLAVFWLGGNLASGLVAIARGENGSPYGWLLATGGVAYLAAVVFLRWRG